MLFMMRFDLRHFLLVSLLTLLDLDTFAFCFWEEILLRCVTVKARWVLLTIAKEVDPRRAEGSDGHNGAFVHDHDKSITFKNIYIQYII